MTDFDFDELDKAVNTALGSNGNTEEAPKEAAAPHPAQPAPAVRRSSGRFMDVVHPSSDMRTDSRTRSVVAPASTASSSNAAVANTPLQADPPTSPPPLSPPPQKDSLDLLDDFDWNAPLESPFLPGAQVEKRPLGGSAPTGDSLHAALEVDTKLLLEEPDELRLEEPDELRLEEPDEPRLEASSDIDFHSPEHIMPDPIDFATKTADTAIDAAEADNTATDSELSRAAALDSEAHIVPGAEEVASATFDMPSTPPASPVASVTTEETTAVELATGPVSITQQYKEKPTEAVESGAIYDTENYHQPITAPVKKKSGAWVIVWILLILVLGGGAGAAFYFVVLPKL